MAKKRAKKKPGKTQDKNQEELIILEGQQVITVGKKKVTVSEFTFVQEFEALPIAQPIIAGLGDAIGESEPAGYQKLEALFYRHHAALVTLIALATGEPEGWIMTLKGVEGSLLTMAFWGVNKDFFISRVVVQTLEGNPEMAASLAQASAKSTPP